MREELASATAHFMARLPTVGPSIPDGAVSWLAKLADMVTRARSPVLHDGYKRELNYAPEPEGPARFMKQLYALTQGITLVNGHHVADAHDLFVITRVGRDCITKVR